MKSYNALLGQPTRSGEALSADGSRLRWTTFGRKQGNRWPTVVCSNGIGCSTFFWQYISRYLSRLTEVLVYDYRGHGASDPPGDRARVAMADNADDLEAVLEDAHVTDALLLGHSMGCQVNFEHYRRHPARVRGLVPMFGTYGRATYTFFNTDLIGRYFHVIEGVASRVARPLELGLRTTRHNPLLIPISARLGLVNRTMIKKPDLAPYVEHMSGMDLRFFLAMAGKLGEHNAEDLLPNIQVPVLIIGGAMDIFTPVWLSEKMHSLIPGSEMMILPGGSHAALVEQPEVINLRIEKFVRERLLDPRRRGVSDTAQVLEDTSDERAHMKGEG